MTLALDVMDLERAWGKYPGWFAEQPDRVMLLAHHWGRRGKG